MNWFIVSKRNSFRKKRISYDEINQAKSSHTLKKKDEIDIHSTIRVNVINLTLKERKK